MPRPARAILCLATALKHPAGEHPIGPWMGGHLNTQNPRLELSDDHWCFACGRENPRGLHTSWSLEEDGAVRALFRPDRHHQGWKGVVHGGILAALLDEAMAQRLRFSGIHGVTARLTIRYRRPAPTEGVLVVEARILSDHARALRLEALVRDEAGRCFAEGDGTCVRMGEDGPSE